MTSEAMRQLTRTLRSIFLLSVIFAVLWVKGYLWWVFGIAVFLYLAMGLMGLNPPSYVEDIPEEDDEFDEDDDEDEDDDIPSVPPPRPHFPRQ